MKITNSTTVEDVIVILKEVDFLDQLEAVFIPVELPEMTYGQRIDLSYIETVSDFLFLPQRILRSLPEQDVMSLPFISVYNYGMSVVKELERMNERDNNTFAYTPTSEEVRAGYYEIDHGIFGSVDRIALRLGIPHERVFDLPEKRVFAMLKIDFNNGMYQRKLNKIMSKQK